MTSAYSRLSVVTVIAVLVALVVPQVAGDTGSVPVVRDVARAAPVELAAKGAGRHPSVGVVDHALWGDRTMRQRREMLRKIAGANARWVRIGLPWALVQPHKPSSRNGGWTTWAFDRVDAVVRAARRNGMQVSMTLVGTPKWANGGRGDKYLPDNPKTYGRAIGRLAKRYRGKVGSWEIWNEANHTNYLKGATVREYKQVLCAAHPAVKRNAPGAKVLSAGTAGVDVDWIRKLYQLGGKRCFDVLAVHPYTGGRSPHYSWNGGTPRWLAELHQMRKVMRRHGDAHTRVWFTEFGYSTFANRAEGGVSRRQQAKWMVEMIKMTDRRLPYVTRMSVYMSRDERIPDIKRNRHYGLYTYKMKPKRSARALKRYLARADGR